MAYYTEDTNRRSVVSLSEIPTSFSDVMAAQQASTFIENPEVAAARSFELLQAERTGARLDQATALERVKSAGLEGLLQIDAEGATRAELDILIDRKRDEVARADTIARGRGGLLEGAARFGVAFGTAMSSPTNAALSFVPIVGQARYARMLALARTPLARAGVRAGVGALEGAAGAALIEPLIYSAKQHEQADYDALDSLLNVAFGTVLGGGLHVVGGASADAISALRGEATVRGSVRRALDAAAEERARPVTRSELEAGGEPLSAKLDEALELGAARLDGEAARTVAQASAETREAALRTAEGQALSGERINVEPHFAGERGQLPNGIDTTDLVPTRFDVEPQRPRAALLVDDANRRIARIEEQALAAGAGAKPRYTPRLLRELTVARAHLAAAQALLEGRSLDAAGIEAVRQATIADALDEGIAVPSEALTGLPDSIIARAAEVRRERQAQAAQQAASAPDPDAPAQEARTAEIDRETSEFDDALEAAEEEAKLAEQLLEEQAARFGEDGADPTIEAANEIAQRLTTWARAAEIAQVCVLRGG